MFLLILCVIYLPVVASTDNQYSALHFGTSTSDLISFQYDMAPFRDSLSICTWIKRIYTSSSHPVVFHYYVSNYEIAIGSDGRYNKVVADTGLENRRFTVPVGTWFSYCITWSVASTTIKLYLDGDLVATDRTPSGRRLKMGGTLVFGGHYRGGYSYHVFGGDLYQFNVYSNVLESADIKKIADGGLCFDLEEFSDTRILRWEDILDRSRSGSVSEVEGCPTKELNLITLLREKLASVTGRLNGKEAQLSKSEEKVETLTNLLHSTQEELESSQLNFTEAKKQLNVTKEKLVTTEEELKGVTSDLEEVTADLEEVTADLEEVTADLEEVTADLEEVTAEMEEVTADLEEVTADLEEVTADLEEVTADLEEVTADLEEVTADLEGVTADLEEVTADLEEVTADLEEVTADLEGVTADLEEVTADLEEVTADLEEVTADMNRTEAALETVTGDLNSTQVELGAVSDDLETCSAGLKDIGRKFKESRTVHNVTRWDILLTPPYFNKVFSNELFQQLTTSCNMLGKWCWECFCFLCCYCYYVCLFFIT